MNQQLEGKRVITNPTTNVTTKEVALSGLCTITTVGLLLCSSDLRSRRLQFGKKNRLPYKCLQLQAPLVSSSRLFEGVSNINSRQIRPGDFHRTFQYMGRLDWGIEAMRMYHNLKLRSQKPNASFWQQNLQRQEQGKAGSAQFAKHIDDEGSFHDPEEEGKGRFQNFSRSDNRRKVFWRRELHDVQRKRHDQNAYRSSGMDGQRVARVGLLSSAADLR